MQIEANLQGAEKEMMANLRAMMKVPLMREMAKMAMPGISDEDLEKNEQSGLAMVEKKLAEQAQTSITVNLPSLNELPEELKMEVAESIQQQLKIFLALVKITTEKCQLAGNTDFAENMTIELTELTIKSMPSLSDILKMAREKKEADTKKSATSAE